MVLRQPYGESSAEESVLPAPVVSTTSTLKELIRLLTSVDDTHSPSEPCVMMTVSGPMSIRQWAASSI